MRYRLALALSVVPLAGCCSQGGSLCLTRTPHAAAGCLPRDIAEPMPYAVARPPLCPRPAPVVTPPMAEPIIEPVAVLGSPEVNPLPPARERPPVVTPTDGPIPDPGPLDPPAAEVAPAKTAWKMAGRRG